MGDCWKESAELGQARSHEGPISKSMVAVG